MSRIFVAIPISEELQNGITEWRKYHSNLPVRWLDGKNLHITLIPPWQTDNIEVEIEKLKSIRHQPFDIQFKRVNFGPDPKRPRLIWAENKPTRQILDLRDKAEGIFGVESEYKQWKMHITLARFEPEIFSSFPVKNLDEVIWWPEQVKSVVLMESHLGSKGADYEIKGIVELI